MSCSSLGEVHLTDSTPFSGRLLDRGWQEPPSFKHSLEAYAVVMIFQLDELAARAFPFIVAAHAQQPEGSISELRRQFGPNVFRFALQDRLQLVSRPAPSSDLR